MNIHKVYHTLRLLLCKNGYMRAIYIGKKKLFGKIGIGCYFHPYWMPSDPKRLFIHDNVAIASDVKFVNHDMLHLVFNQKNGCSNLKMHFGDIEIFENTMIGTGVTILPGCKIGPNCIIGAGAVVSKDIPPNTVAVGNPIRVIGSFEELEKKRMVDSHDDDR